MLLSTVSILALYWLTFKNRNVRGAAKRMYRDEHCNFLEIFYYKIFFDNSKGSSALKLHIL